MGQNKAYIKSAKNIIDIPQQLRYPDLESSLVGILFQQSYASIQGCCNSIPAPLDVIVIIWGTFCCWFSEKDATKRQRQGHHRQRNIL